MRIGQLRIGQLRIGQLRIGQLRVDRLRVDRLRIVGARFFFGMEGRCCRLRGAFEGRNRVDRY